MTDEVFEVCLYGTGFTLNGKHIPLEQVYIMPEPKELPLYTCHKKVRALEIQSVGNYRTDNAGALVRGISFRDGYPSLDMPASMFARHTPMPGDFYVVYEDGYASFSPRRAFLEGYTREETDPR